MQHYLRMARLAVWMLVLGISVSTAQAQEWVVINISSQPNALPAMGEAEFLPDLAGLKAVTDGENIYPVDVVDGLVFVDCVVPAMTEIRLLPSIEVVEERGVVSSEDGIITFRGGGKRIAPGTAYDMGALSSWKVQLLEEYLVSREMGEKDKLDSPIDLICQPGSEVVRMEKVGKWALEERKLTGSLSALLCAPAKEAVDGTVSAAAAFHPLIAAKNASHGWRIVRNGASANFYHRGENDEYPDLEEDIWAWSDMNKNGLGAWAFSRQGKTAILRCYDLAGLGEAHMMNFPKEDDAYFRLPGAQGGGETTLEPAFQIDDPTGRQFFFQGDLLSGGPLFASYSKSNGGLDLDDDGDVDVYVHGVDDPVASQISSGALKFDMMDDFPGFFVPYSVKPGVYKMDTSFRYIDKMGRYGWVFSKTFLSGRVYKGAKRGFEEHILYKIREGDEGPLEGTAAFFLKTTNDDIDRLTMGAFGGSDGNFIDWNIELDPEEANENPEAAFRICEYEDPRGQKVRFTSSVYPQDWDGKAFAFKERPCGDIDFNDHCAWYKVANGDLFELKSVLAVFFMEGGYMHSTEGMYTGRLQTGNRAEKDFDSPKKFTLYYSPLFGGLHLSGAEFGYIGFDTNHKRPGLNELKNFYHKEAVDMPDGRWIGGRQVHDLEGTRLECPMFLCYMDMDGNGFQDAYLWDAKNDGHFERTFRYNEAAQTALLREGEVAVAWNYGETREEADYIIRNYNKIEDLYLKGLKEAPLVVRADFPEAGLRMDRSPDTGLMTKNPAEEIKRYVVSGPEWQTDIALDVAHGAPSTEGWTDFRDVGFTGLGLHAQNAGLTPVLLEEKFSAETLKDVEILVLPQPTQLITDAEMAALVDWVKSGGSLLISPTGDDAETRIALNGLLEPFGIHLTDDRLDVRSSIKKYGLQSGNWNDKDAAIEEERCPSPDQRIEHFDSEEKDLLERFRFLTAVGFPLETSKAWKSLLSYEGKTVVSEAALGEGHIMVSGINLFANRYLNHAQYIQPEADNTWLIGRLMQRIAERHKVLEMEIADDGESLEVKVFGRGGSLSFPKSLGSAITINGARMDAKDRDGLLEVTAPAGESLVKIQ